MILHSLIVIALASLLLSLVNGQIFSQLGGQRTSSETTDIIDVLINPDGSVNITKLEELDIFQLTGNTGEVQNYAMFSNLDSQQGNLTLEVFFGEPEILVELELTAYTPKDVGTLKFVTYDVMTDTIDQVVDKLMAIERTNGFNGAPNQQTIVGPDTGPSSPYRRRRGNDPDSSSSSSSPGEEGAKSKGKNKGKGGVTVSAHGAHEKYRVMAESLRDDFERQLRLIEAEGEAAVTFDVDTGRWDIIPSLRLRPLDHIFVERPAHGGRGQGQGELAGHPRYFNPLKLGPSPPSPKSYMPFNIPTPLQLEYLSFYQSRVRKVLSEHKSQTGHNSKRGGPGYYDVSKLDDPEFFKEVGGSCEGLTKGWNSHRNINNCQFQAIEHFSAQQADFTSEINRLTNYTQSLEARLNLTEGAIEVLRDADVAMQKQLKNVALQLELVFGALDKSDQKFADLYAAQAITSQSIDAIANNMLVLEGQQKRTDWLNDQNFKATQEAFSGMEAQQRAIQMEQNQNLELLRLQQNANDLISNQVVFNAIAESLLQSTRITDLVRLELNLQSDMSFEKQGLVNEEISYHLNQLTSGIERVNDVIKNTFTAIRDLQRMTMGNNDLALQYHSDKAGMENGGKYQYVVLNCTGKPPTPINKDTVISGHSLNITMLNPGHPCITSPTTQSIATAAVTNVTNYKHRYTILVPNNRNPYFIKTPNKVMVSPTTKRFIIVNLNNDKFAIGVVYLGQRYLLGASALDGGVEKSILLIQDSDTTRANCRQSNTFLCSNLFFIEFSLAKWSSPQPTVSDSQMIAEQSVVVPFLAYNYTTDAGNMYYLNAKQENSTGTPRMQLILTKYTNTTNATAYQHVKNMFVLNTYAPASEDVIRKRFHHQVPFEFNVTRLNFSMIATSSTLVYPQLTNRYLWLANYGISQYSATLSSVLVPFDEFYIDSAFSSPQRLGSVSRSANSATENDVLIDSITSEYNRTFGGDSGGNTRRRSSGDNEGSDASSSSSSSSNLKLPPNWEDLLPKVEQVDVTPGGKPVRSQKTGTGKGSDADASADDSDGAHGNKKRSLTQAGTDQEPGTMEECYFGVKYHTTFSGTYNHYYNTELNAVEKTFADKCVTNPKCTLYQTEIPRHANFLYDKNLGEDGYDTAEPMISDTDRYSYWKEPIGSYYGDPFTDTVDKSIGILDPGSHPFSETKWFINFPQSAYVSITTSTLSGSELPTGYRQSTLDRFQNLQSGYATPPKVPGLLYAPQEPGTIGVSGGCVTYPGGPAQLCSMMTRIAGLQVFGLSQNTPTPKSNYRTYVFHGSVPLSPGSSGERPMSPTPPVNGYPNHISFCAPYNPEYLTLNKPNLKMPFEFDYLVPDSLLSMPNVTNWLNMTISPTEDVAAICTSSTDVRRFNLKACFGVKFSAVINPLAVKRSFTSCEKFNWNSCADPALSGLCVQGLKISESTPGPAGTQMEPGCVFATQNTGCSAIPSGQIENCTTHSTLNPLTGVRVPLCTYDTTTSTCRNYDPITDPIYILATTASTTPPTVRVDCTLRMADTNGCLYDEQCMLIRVLGAPQGVSGVTTGTSASCVNIVKVPLSGGKVLPFFNNSISLSAFNPESFNDPFGSTDINPTMVDMCSDSGVYCSVKGSMATTKLNWLMQANNTNPSNPADDECESISTTLTDLGSCTNRRYFRLPNSNSSSPSYTPTFAPKCRVSANRRCEMDCALYQKDLNPCTKHSYCGINRDTMTCFHGDNYMSVCPEYTTSPFIPGSRCLKPNRNLCSLLSPTTDLYTGLPIPKGVSPSEQFPPPHVVGWSTPLLKTSETIMLASFITGNLSLFDLYIKNGTMGTSSRLYGIVSLPVELDKACLAYEPGTGIWLSYERAIFQMSPTDVLAIKDELMDGSAIEMLTKRQACLPRDPYECLSLTEYQSQVPACAYINSARRTLGVCARLDNVEYLRTQFGDNVIIHDQASFMDDNSIRSETMTLTPIEYISIFQTAFTEISIMSPSNTTSHVALSMQVTLINVTVPCDTPGYAPVGSLCCPNGGVCTENAPGYRNPNYPQWAYVKAVQERCAAVSTSGNWSVSTIAQVDVYCKQQYSYSDKYIFGVTDPNLANVEIARIQGMINRNETLPEPIGYYTCKHGVPQYLEGDQGAFRFVTDSGLLSEEVITVDSCGNHTPHRVAPLDRLPSDSPVSANGVYHITTYARHRKVKPFVTLSSVGVLYEFDHVTDYQWQSLAFSPSKTSLLTTGLREIKRSGRGLITASGWTVNSMFTNSLLDLMGNDTESMLLTNTNVYGPLPQSWGVRHDFGARFQREFGGTTPLGEPVTKSDSLTVAYIERDMVPIYVVSNVITTYTTKVVATGSDGKTITVRPTKVILSSQGLENLPKFGDYLIYERDIENRKIYSAYGRDIIMPCQEGGYARICSRESTFNDRDFFNTVLDFDPMKLKSLVSLSSNMVSDAGIDPDDTTLPINVCGDALGRVTSLPIINGVTEKQITFILQFLDYGTLSTSPNCDERTGLCTLPNSALPTLWSWWSAKISVEGYGNVIDAFNLMIETWSSVKCIYGLSNWVPTIHSRDFIRRLWEEFYDNIGHQLNRSKLRSYMKLISDRGNTFACGNCRFLYPNVTGGTPGGIRPPPLAPPVGENPFGGTTPYGYCIISNGTKFPDGTQPDYIIDLLKATNNVPCRVSGEFSTRFKEKTDNGTRWAFVMTMRPGVGVIQPFFNSPKQGDIKAITSTTACPLLTGGGRYATQIPGGFLANLTNAYPFALSIWAVVTTNISHPVTNLTDDTSIDACNYKTRISLRGVNSTLVPITLCTGQSYLAFYASNLATNCTPWLKVDLDYQAYYESQASIVDVQRTVYQTAFIEQQRKLDESIRNLNHLSDEKIKLNNNLITQLNTSFSAEFDTLNRQYQSLNGNVTNLKSITAQNVVDITDLRIGFVQTSNNISGISNSLDQVIDTQGDLGRKFVNLTDDLSEEARERNRQYEELKAENKNQSDTVDKITDEILPEIFKQIEKERNESAKYREPGEIFRNTRDGQRIAADLTTVWVVVSVIGAVNLAMGIVGVMAYVKFTKQLKGVAPQNGTGSKPQTTTMTMPPLPPNAEISTVVEKVPANLTPMMNGVNPPRPEKTYVGTRRKFH